MKEQWFNVLPVYGLRYHSAWLFTCVISFVFISTLINYRVLESWIYLNDQISVEQQNKLFSLLQPLAPLRLDGPLLRWQERFRQSEWLWQPYQVDVVNHPVKNHYKQGSKPLFYYSERQPLQVLLVGDSLAESLQMSLSPLLSNIPSIQLKSSSIVSSTLTNKHFADWPQTLRNLLNQQQYDLVLVFIGVNSCQAVRYDDGSVVGYGSKNWSRAYKGEVQNFIQIIKNGGAAVWWMINPPMLKAKYQNCIQLINKIQREVATEKADEIIETGPIISAKDGSYTQSKIIGGKLYSLRSKDGVHFTIAGSRFISEEVFRWIYQRYKIRLGKSFGIKNTN